MANVYTDGEIDRPKWTGLQKLSFLTLPVALLGVVLVWLAFFTMIYDALCRFLRFTVVFRLCEPGAVH